MFKAMARCVLFSFAFFPRPALADPIELKLAFFSSDRSASYLGAVEPFLSAVNSEGNGRIKIVLYSGGVLGRDVAQQPQAVLDGKADIAFVVPGYTPDRFPDNSVVELPGLFRNTREATLVYTRLVALNALKGYEEFVVLGAYVTEPETFHSRLPIASIDDLKGKRIRVNNPSESATLEKLGAIPVALEIAKIADALSSGAIDGAEVARTPLADFGIKRVATYHYFLRTSGAPLALIMNRKKFETLPAAIQDLLRKYSGEWTAARFIENYDRSDELVSEQMKADQSRKIVYPSSSDMDRANIVFKSVITEWIEKDPHHRELFDKTENELANLRAKR